MFNNLCTELLLGGDFLQQHKQVIFRFDSDGRNLVIDKSSNTCVLSEAKVECPSLFSNLLPNCKPIATKSRRFNSSDQQFINVEVNRLHDDNIIRPSVSPWRSQVVVVKTKDETASQCIDDSDEIKRRLCIDYSQTINLFTLLDAYPIPHIHTMVNNLAKYNVFATYDLRSAYHQIPICESDKPYTAFEAGGKLWEFNRIPFGVTNGGPIFQRKWPK